MGRHAAPELERPETDELEAFILPPDTDPFVRWLCYVAVAFFAVLGFFAIIITLAG